MSEMNVLEIPEDVAKSGEAARMAVKDITTPDAPEKVTKTDGTIDLSPPKVEPEAPVMSGSAEGEGAAGGKTEKEIERLRSELARKSGEYGANIQNLQAQLKELQERLTATTSAARQGVDTAQAAQPPASAALPAEPTRADLAQTFGEEYLTNYGEDFAKTQYKAMRKMAEAGRPSASSAPMPIQDVEKVVSAKVQETLQQRDAQQAEAAFFSAVEKAAPGATKVELEWEANGWSDFLNQDDPATGINRRALATMAKESGAVGTVARIYKEFMRPNAASRASAPPPIEQQIAPPSEQRTPETRSSRPLVSREKFQEFAEAVRLYPERFTSEQIAKVKDEYQRAAMDGRLVP